ncbi:DUF4142 domain-containing protein [Actinoplanes missouriensis]|uniref:DUF4142 domain-containing protein n=1 Tax=Actinoplanes missouriensis TaxID=1866 RepID=UPI0033DFE99E
MLAVAAVSPAQARPVSADADFLIAAHQGNLAQMAAGKIAKHQGASEPVRDLGRELATYHRKLDVTVRRTAARLEIRLPAEPNSEQQALIEQYRAASGADFDTLFLGSQLLAHERAIKLAQVVIDTGTEPSVEKLAGKALPVIQRHQQAIAATQQKVDAASKADLAG